MSKTVLTIQSLTVGCRQRLIVCSALLALTSCESTPGNQPQALPNILILYADDLGWNDLGCYGNQYHKTPAIDRLCNAGTRFTDAYSDAPVCAPARASLLSGRGVLDHGIYCINDPEDRHPEARKFDSPPNQRRLPTAMPTLANVLQRAGYRTGCYGKWHLGYDGEKVSPWHPLNRGFEEAVQTRSPSGKRRYFYPDFSTIPSVPVPDGQHLSDFVSDEAIKFLSRDDGRPFFLYLPYFSVHGPREAKPESLAAMSGIERRKTDDHIYASMCMDLDQAIGRVLSALDEQGLADNTLVVFASDNGAIARYDNSPFQKGKGWLHEGGIRVPMIMRWPGVVPAAATCEVPASAIDLFPTLCKAANVPPPAECDGVNLLPAICSGEESNLRDRDLFWHYPTYGKYRKGRFQARPVSAIRCGRHKLLFDYESGAAALYDLAEDPGEDRDLSSEQPLLAQQMQMRLFKWLDQNPSLSPQPRKKMERR